MIAFIDDHREAHGVEPICKVLPIAPSTYYNHVAKRVDPCRLPARAHAQHLSHRSGAHLRRICSWSCSSWLRLLKSWSLRQTRGGSDSYLAATIADLALKIAHSYEASGPQP
jgi:hypothetical protein